MLSCPLNELVGERSRTPILGIGLWKFGAWTLDFECTCIFLGKLSTSRLPLNSMLQTVTPHFAFVNEHATYSTCGVSLVKYSSPCMCLSLSSSFEGPYTYKAMHKDVLESCGGQEKSDLLEEPNLTEKIQIKKRWSIDKDKEIQRRRRIGLANKGKQPWNKGLKLSEEARERISRRTKEALRDPKVRKKMSQAPRPLSNRTKARIRAALIKVWGKRQNWKRSREEFIQSWVESIAKAAKIGGSDQQELDWDSYEKLERELALRLQEEKAKEKVMARIRAELAERAAKARAERTVRFAQERRGRDENARARGESVKKLTKMSKAEKEKLAESQELKLKERLVKIHKKKSAITQVTNQNQRTWEKFNLDIVKTEQLQKEVSLADQIRFAKKKRGEQLLDS